MALRFGFNLGRRMFSAPPATAYLALRPISIPVTPPRAPYKQVVTLLHAAHHHFYEQSYSLALETLEASMLMWINLQNAPLQPKEQYYWRLFEGEILRDSGHPRLAREKYAEALKASEQMLQTDPDACLVCLSLGSLEFFEANFKNALERFKDAESRVLVSVGPKSVFAHVASHNVFVTLLSDLSAQAFAVTPFESCGTARDSLGFIRDGLRAAHADLVALVGREHAVTQAARRSASIAGEMGEHMFLARAGADADVAAVLDAVKALCPPPPSKAKKKKKKKKKGRKKKGKKKGRR
eukprot:gnl/Chilomastix_cuspidata/3393.p1 GENE.gnl/Chilomastix_cuspidata/3393~~gnl/Chilomastix_cuspidata/3393.p1  ORF type:complete len:296 (-),score=149.16 gnl/Chilomastix_cuspidata/3393:359-1246(-)